MQRRTAIASLAAVLLLFLGLAAWFVGSHRGATPAGASAAGVERSSQRVGPNRDPEPLASVVSSAGAASDARRDPRRDELRGRCLDERDGRAVSGAWVQLLQAAQGDAPQGVGTALAEATSDGRGEFSFPWPAQERSFLRVEAPYGWVVVGSDRAWVPPEPTAEGARFLLRPARRATLRLELLDERTGEPLPDYLLGLRNPRTLTTWQVLTDARGLAETDVPIDEGSYQLMAIDDPRIESGWTRSERPASLEFTAEPDAAPLRIELGVGPTYLLDLRAPPGLALDTLETFLLNSRAQLLNAGRQASGPVRLDASGGLPWMRLREGQVAGWLFAVESVPMLLVVADRAGEWLGSAPIELRWGRQREPVRIEFERTGSLQLRALDGNGQGLAGADLRVASTRGGFRRSARSDADYATPFEGLPVGEYSVLATRSGCRPARATLSVQGGRSTQAELRLLPASVAGAVQGTASSPLGPAQDLGTWRVVLTSDDDAGQWLEAALEFEERAGERVAAFRFVDVPEGRYRCSLSGRGRQTWWPEVLELRPPARGLAFRQLQREDLQDLYFEIVNARSGEALEGWFRSRPEGVPASLGATSEYGSGFQQHVPRDVELEWGAGAPGHVARFGSRADLRVEEGLLIARAELEPGFGVLLEFVDPDLLPLAGVQLTLDGQPAGTSDALGRLFARAEGAPAQATLEAPGWVCAQDLLAQLGDAARVGMPLVQVSLVRR